MLYCDHWILKDGKETGELVESWSVFLCFSCYLLFRFSSPFPFSLFLFLLLCVSGGLLLFAFVILVLVLIVI